MSYDIFSNCHCELDLDLRRTELFMDHTLLLILWFYYPTKPISWLANMSVPTRRSLQKECYKRCANLPQSEEHPWKRAKSGRIKRGNMLGQCSHLNWIEAKSFHLETSMACHPATSDWVDSNCGTVWVIPGIWKFWETVIAHMASGKCQSDSHRFK